LYPKIDVQIATFSQRLLKSVLREQLSFKGLVISDDLEMKAVLDILLRRQIGLDELKLCGLDLAIVSQNTRALEEELVKVVLENRSSVSIQEELCPAFSELTNLDRKIFDEGKKLLEKIENKF
jgi:beta-N-acetylhexosaminidase